MATKEVTLAALEQELIFAKQVAPGGQKTDPGRIAAIEAEIKAYSATKDKPVEKTDKSNESTDYESHDDKKVKAARNAHKPENADAKSATENADA
jgi:hypothetical protein